jgi:hypothetical protein
MGRQKPVGGRLSVFFDRLRWEPTIWLGRVEAQPWELPIGAVTGVSLTKQPLPAIRSFQASIATKVGNV